MLNHLLALVPTLTGVVLIDGFATPRRSDLAGRARAFWLLICVSITAFGVLLGLSGNPTLAAALTLAMHLLLVFASNAKSRVLGEPLVFTDLALVGAVFRHPQFYFSVLAVWQKIAGFIAALALAAVLAWLARPGLAMAMLGAAVAAAGLGATWLSFRIGLFDKLACRPDIAADAAALGLVPSLILYWLRWRAGKAGPALAQHGTALVKDGPNNPDAAQLIVVVQCESFADPVELFGDLGHALPALDASRADAVQWGSLLVSSFGAYTMRTEYGVLFGRDETELGFRRYDPYLTAIEDARHALPNRLNPNRWQSLFVHPHDMCFYGRDRILPAAGFAKLVNEEAFARPASGDGRYVTDAAVADKILELANGTRDPAFIYAVTIENHGPWATHGKADRDMMIANYNRLVRAGDAMLGRLREEIAALGRPAILVFFGDHRPSIPRACSPGGARHTPYVMIQFDGAGQIVAEPNRRKDLTPAQLHHAILELNLGRLQV
ncbi:MAG: capsular biosynthesis protein [Alphaproteobacteria bacterium HGW-Alphaproteobacteria-14]|nr:MAG: capsular biosynthesis protein [Alphaproteobacteria bacterium HGW-Alphaproteobacteria-14]